MSRTGRRLIAKDWSHLTYLTRTERCPRTTTTPCIYYRYNLEFKCYISVKQVVDRTQMSRFFSNNLLITYTIVKVKVCL